VQSDDVEITLPSQVYAGLQRMAHTAGVPLKSVLLTAHLKVLSLLSGTTDVLTGLVSHGRPEKPDAEKTLGLFLNVLPFRFQFQEPSWHELVQQVFALERQHLSFRHYPVAHTPRPNSTLPRFDTVFNFVHFHVFKALQNLQQFTYLGGTFSDPFPYTLKANFIQHPLTSSLLLSLNYNRHTLCDEQLQAIKSCYSRVLSTIAATDTCEAWHEDEDMVEAAESACLSCPHRSADGAVSSGLLERSSSMR
jgi:microcystin synthetase protein McyA